MGSKESDVDGVGAGAGVESDLAGDLKGEAGEGEGGNSERRREPGMCPPKNVSGVVSAERRLSMIACTTMAYHK